ncbi:MAG: phosphatidylserine decarboxylase family protein [Bacteroidaceae bacterium]|nr:phosphatidylserine decarboxylase family protein [Bacteroidaceae bacterium]
MGKRLRKLRRKIRIHSEGNNILILSAVVFALFCTALHYGFETKVPFIVFTALLGVAYCIMLNFFRCPIREFEQDTKGVVVAPADGKIVVVEEVEENEYFHDRRLMVSIFMNLFNVHANWIPIDGHVKLVRHHDGNYHMAWLPKASIENERSTIVITSPEGEDILVRQIAGAVARRVVTYLEEGEEYEIDEHLGFIKFGSRVDVYLPLGTEVCVELGQKTTGNETVIAKLNSK